MQYKGYTYQPWSETESDGDNSKIFHDVLTPTGETITIDWSPYSYPTQDDFIIWIDLGMPKRRGVGSLNRMDLLAMGEQKWGENFIKELSLI